MNTQTQPRAAGQAAHSKTPWVQDRLAKDPATGLYYWHIQDREGEDGYLIALVPASNPHMEADCEFIVRACNEYATLRAQNAALLKALEHATVALEALDGPAGQYRLTPEQFRALRNARAALAQARSATN